MEMDARAMLGMIIMLMVVLLHQAHFAKPGRHVPFPAATAIVGDVPKPNTYLDGDKWTARAGKVVVPSTVPGDIITDLQRAGMVGDPMYGVNWRDQSGVWAKESGWSFTRIFDYRTVASPSVLLVLDGVKMAADVYLNRVHLGGPGRPAPPV